MGSALRDKLRDKLRVVARLGLVAPVGELATAFGLPGWPLGAVVEAAFEVLGLWLKRRGGTGSVEVREAIERVRASLAAHGSARCERHDGAAHDQPVTDRAGWRDGSRFDIAIDAWRKIMAGLARARAARHLRNAGFLTAGTLADWPPGCPGRCWDARASMPLQPT